MLKNRTSYFKWSVSFLVVLFIIIIASGLIFHTRKKGLCEKCNVILVSLDTLSALHLPCYGYEKNTAPNLCAYANKNLLFLNSYSQSPITLDSHFSIFTSVYPHTHKMTSILDKDFLNDKYLTLAQVLRSNKYQTIYTGPLNDPHLPLNKGIERGFSYITGAPYEAISEWDKTYSKLRDNIESKKPTFVFLHTYSVHEPSLVGHKQKHLFTDLPEDQDIPLTQQEVNKEIISPSLEFYKFVADLILSNHRLADEESVFLFENEKDKAIKLQQATNVAAAAGIFNSFSDALKKVSVYNWHTRVNIQNPQTIEYLKALYDEQIYDLDQKLAKLFKLMDDPRINNNTILIITSDHGQEYMEHGQIYHANNLFTTSTRVPLIVHIPGVKAHKITNNVEGIDIYPTILGLLGLKPQSKLAGIDLGGIISGKKDSKVNKYLLSEYNGVSGVQKDNLRFYFNNKNYIPTGLYDLNYDPLEQNNLILREPEILRGLMSNFMKKRD